MNTWITLCSADQPSCPQVLDLEDGGVQIRDSKDESVVLTFTADEKARLAEHLSK